MYTATAFAAISPYSITRRPDSVIELAHQGQIHPVPIAVASDIGKVKDYFGAQDKPFGDV